MRWLLLSDERCFLWYSSCCFSPPQWLCIRQTMTNQEKDFHTLSSCPYLFRHISSINCGAWWQQRMLLGGPQKSFGCIFLPSGVSCCGSSQSCRITVAFVLHLGMVACCSLTSGSCYIMEFPSKPGRNSASSLTISLDYLLIYKNIWGRVNQ